MQWTEDEIQKFRDASTNTEIPYQGKSMLVFAFPRRKIKDDKTDINHETIEYVKRDAVKDQQYTNENVTTELLYQSITQSIQPTNPSWYCSSKLLLNSIIHKNRDILYQLSVWLQALNVYNNVQMRRNFAAIDNSLDYTPGKPFSNNIDELADWMWTLNDDRYFQMEPDWLGELGVNIIYDENSDTAGRPLTKKQIGGRDSQFLDTPMSGIEVARTMMYSLWKGCESVVCRYIFQDTKLWENIDVGGWTMHRFICYVLAKIIIQYGTDENLSISTLVAWSLSAADTSSMQNIIRQVTEYTKIDVSKFADSMVSTTVVSDLATMQRKLASLESMMETENYRYFSIYDYISQGARGAVSEETRVYLDEIHNEAMPTSDLPNPLILNDLFAKDVRKQLKLDPEGIHILSDAGEFLFWEHYKDNVNATSETTLEYYKDQTDSIFAHALSISASEHIRGNTCDIPCLAYHGNMKYTRYDGGYSDVKCIGHLGNSFPGVANVRDGRGVIPANTLANVFGNK